MRVELKKLLEGSLEGDPGATVLLEYLQISLCVDLGACV